MRRWRQTPAGKASQARRNCRRRAQRQADPNIQRTAKLKHRYGITPEQYDEMLAQQGGACAICLSSEVGAIHVDHDHTTGRIRGLLCASCNRGLGLFRDSAENLARAIDYLKP